MWLVVYTFQSNILFSDYFPGKTLLFEFSEFQPRSYKLWKIYLLAIWVVVECLEYRELKVQIFITLILTGFERKEQIEKLSYVKKLGRNLVCKNTVVIVINWYCKFTQWLTVKKN